MLLFSDAQIGLGIKAARRKAGLTAKSLAEQSGLSASAISRIESGKQTLSFAESLVVCKVLGMQVNNLASLARGALPLARETADAKLRLLHDLQQLERQCVLGAVESTACERSRGLT